MTATDLTSGRGVAATWWYTFGSVVLFVVAMLFVWVVRALGLDSAPQDLPLLLGGFVVFLCAFLFVALRYRMVLVVGGVRFSTREIVLVALGAVGGAVSGYAAASVTLFIALAGSMLCILPWPAGIRGRLTGGITLLLTICAVLEYERLLSAENEGAAMVMVLLFTVVLPGATVIMLWWWDIVRELDRARLTESTLAATQERLRMASDVHDLQGHHLQVIALQLELAERLIERDAAGALEQIRAAQNSVDEARDGTKALATRFRGVPLPDELANAADLLRAAGIEVTLEVAQDAADAPSDVLGPVVRESTTNILKHGSGGAAALRLAHEGGEWVFSSENDAEGVLDAARGTGLAGMTARLEDAGGRLRVSQGQGVFAVQARVPRRGER